MEKLIKELNLEGRVFLPGFNKDINNTIQHASLFVLSSDFEGMPNALIESMAMGIPCVATDCDGGSARYLIDDGKNGFLVPKGDVDALSEKMLMLLSNESLAMTMGREAAKIRMMLSPEVIYNKWERFIDTIIHV
jgi:Glycosyltransferase